MAEKLKTFIGNEEWNVEHFIRHILREKLNSRTFTILDLSDLVYKCENWKRKMPRVRPHYAVKCNNNKIALRVLAAFGFGFDCASQSEIDLVLSVGVSPESIVFAHTAKHQKHMEFAREKGIDLHTFDGKFELVKTKYYYPDARLIIRIKNEALVATCPLGQKYGCCPDTEAPDLLLLAKRLNLKVVGVSFHVGSGCKDNYAHANGIAKARKLFDLGKKLGHDMNILDIGGGFAGDVGTCIDKIASQINRSLDENFPTGCGVHIIAEPGRYFVASAFTLACCVHSARVLNDGRSKVMYFMDNGLYESFAGVKVDRLILNPKPLDIDNSCLVDAILSGPTCDGADIVMENVRLPLMPLPSWLLFESFGAYTSATSTNFNGFDAPDEYAFCTDTTWDLLCALKSFRPNLIETEQLPTFVPQKWQPEGPQTEHLYTPNELLPIQREKHKESISFAEHVKTMSSPEKFLTIHSP